MTMDLVAEARRLALEAHAKQKYGDQPYAVHLQAVVGLLAECGDEAQVVGWLHDVVEDAGVSLEELERRFGARAAKCVALVTDEPGLNRKERKARTNAKLALVQGELTLALLVKAADRLANLRASAAGGAGSKLEMYRGEHPAFRQAAYRSGLCDAWWDEMDKILAPPAPEKVS